MYHSLVLMEEAILQEGTPGMTLVLEANEHDKVEEGPQQAQKAAMIVRSSRPTVTPLSACLSGGSF